MATDGKPKFDLQKPNPEYFEWLRRRVGQAKEKGIYCAVMLFDAWAIKWATPVKIARSTIHSTPTTTLTVVTTISG